MSSKSVELINQTDYANIYGVYDEFGKAIGTVEERLAGIDVGTHCYSLKRRYTKNDIRKFFKEARKEMKQCKK